VVISTTAGAIVCKVSSTSSDFPLYIEIRVSFVWNLLEAVCFGFFASVIVFSNMLSMRSTESDDYVSNKTDCCYFHIKINDLEGKKVAC